jgi:hypothetical protein
MVCESFVASKIGYPRSFVSEVCLDPMNPNKYSLHIHKSVIEKVSLLRGGEQRTRRMLLYEVIPVVSGVKVRNFDLLRSIWLLPNTARFHTFLVEVVELIVCLAGVRSQLRTDHRRRNSAARLIKNTDC